MFDPFKDYATEGYLRNRFREKDSRIIKQIEHEVFVRNAPKAQQHLAGKNSLSYADFLEVHRTLFSEFYPWAGQDRVATAPNCSVLKGSVRFISSFSAQRAVEYGLLLGQNHETMRQKPGEVMGLFAYGHPFLDGNGRTMLLVHMELCHRAGFSLDWASTSKMDYLHALSQEIERPGRGILDTYLLQFKGPQVNRSSWGECLATIKGLDGLDPANQVEGDLSDPVVAERYRRFDEQRGYTYAEQPEQANKPSCSGGLEM